MPSTFLSTATTLAATAVVSVLVSAVLVQRLNDRKLEQLLKEWGRRRQEERTGRIRAEVKLRTALRDLQQLEAAGGRAGETQKTMILNCIGTVVSPYVD